MSDTWTKILLSWTSPPKGTKKPWPFSLKKLVTQPLTSGASLARSQAEAVRFRREGKRWGSCWRKYEEEGERESSVISGSEESDLRGVKGSRMIGIALAAVTAPSSIVMLYYNHCS